MRSADLKRGVVYAGTGNASAIALYRSLSWRAGCEADLVVRFPVP